MALLFVAYFTEGGEPKEGLSPTIRARDLSDNSLVISDLAMSEVGDGFYQYIYAGADNAKNYVARAYGGAAQPQGERYVPCCSELVGDIQAIKAQVDTFLWDDVTFLKNIEGGRWKIDDENNQMIFYEGDNETEIARFDLLDQAGNPSVTNVFERRRV
jgi:hypothetical protein